MTTTTTTTTTMQIIWEYDTANVPLTWSKLNEPLDYVDTLSMLDVWLMLLVDTGIHLLVTWYLDNVTPGHFGLPKPFYFFLTRAHWCGHADSSGARHPGMEDVERKYFESDPVGLAVGVNIVHLRKEFGQQVAVRDLSLKMYEGQITVLLGHNGAGKTSIVSMLTGFIPPTAGTAYIHGLDIRTDMAAIGQSLGVCQQHGALFRALTVEDNLSFFARLKGCPGASVKAEVDTMLKEVGLTSMREDRAHQLSRVQERLLSVAIALVHGSKIVILDEPSAGMDPQARRSLWQILQRQRTGRTMLLTTHDMDEAEMLGDRIAIMAEGAVKCCGTSLFLKKRYGAGYHLVLVKAKGCNVPALTTEVRNRVPSATLDNDVGREVTFLLPDNQSDQFPDLFAFLEETKGQLGITDFGASATTLEEVFLKVGESSETGDLKLSSTTRIAVPEEGDGEEAPSATSAAVDENFVGPSAREAASRVSMPEEQSSHGDNDVRSDVDNKLGSDVLNNVEISDVNQNSGDVNQEASGVILTTSVVRMKASDDKQKASNVNQNAKAVDVLALSRGYSRLSGFQLSLSQLQGMVVKKAICWWRSPVLSLIQLLLPVVFAVLVYPVARQSLTLVTRIQGSKGEHPPLTLNLDPFCETTVLYGVFDSLGPEPNVTQPGVKPKASARSSLGKLYAGQFGDNQHEAKEVGSYKEMCKLTTGFSVLDFSRKVIVGAAFWTWGNVSEVLAMGLYNPFPLHAMDIATALVLNAVAKERINSSVNIVPVLYPLPDKSPVTLSPSPEQKIAMQGMLGLLAGLLVGLGMSFHAPLFVSSITSERVTGSKHLQRVSGMSPVVFWAGNLLWDLVVCAPTFAPVIGVLCLADLNPLSGGLPPALIIVLFVLYGPAMLAFNYLTHFCFTTALNAMTSLCFLYLASGVFLPLIVFSLFNRVAGDQGEVYFLDAVCSLLLPAYNLITALIKLFSNYENLSLCESADYKQTCLARESPCCKDYGKGCGPKPCLEFTENYWAFEGGVGKYLIYLSVQSVVFLLLTLEIERRWLAWGGCSWPCYKGVAAKGGGAEGGGVERDSDLAEERRRIESSDVIKLCKQDRVLLKDLSKTYVRVAGCQKRVYDCEPTILRAVERLCVGVAEKECFGLLGQSGAGKSTTLKMLTGEVVMTKGQAFVNGYSVMSQLRQVQRSIGYCPQTDPLIEHMTCYETLAMFGRLRGIPDSHLNDCVASVLEVLELGLHGAKRAGNLSGGMKRKLTTAMSLIGDPSVILLDEPFTGLDPSARRHLWDVLSSVRSGGSTLILTSHSMEECEALCTRVAIMVNGRMKCLGTTQHLKSRFGQGFTLSVRMGLKENGQLASFNPLVTYVQSHFPSAKCFNSDHLQGYAYIQIPDPHTPLSAVFRALESAKLALNVQDYSVHQTSLQQVFLAFTSDQQRYQQPEQEP
ncbi:phospholipid-transporting ATPase ABCA3-like [Littorina saxatilis]